jgi:hypothetical protein
MKLFNFIKKQWKMVLLSIFVMVSLYYIQKHRFLHPTEQTKQVALEGLTNKSNVKVFETAIASIDFENPKYHNPLGDYYVLGSYNTCSNSRDYNNGEVSIDALKETIMNGVRVLDFELYTYEGELVVGVSQTSNHYGIGSVNRLPFKEVMDIVRDYALSPSVCNNYADPLFLNFRMKTKQSSSYVTFVSAMKQRFGQYFLPIHNGNNNGDKSLAPEKLNSLIGKVILMCDIETYKTGNSDFKSYMNVVSGTQTAKFLDDNGVKNEIPKEELQNFNKSNLTITHPSNSDSRMTNFNALVHHKYGCQMVLLSFAHKDNNLTNYYGAFNKAGSAYILKPEKLRMPPPVKVEIIPHTHNEDDIKKNE